MLRKWNDRICAKLHESTEWHLSRCRCLAHIIVAAISARSVTLDDLASHIPGKAKFASKTRRLQLFFQNFDMPQDAIAWLLVSILSPLMDSSWTLALDRTNWTRRGNEVNLLTLSICFGDVAVPLFWVDLRHKGNSNTAQRVKLMERFLDLFGAQRIRVLTADREFIGAMWIYWLKKQKIPFVLRVRENLTVSNARGKDAVLKNCFRNLRHNKHRHLGERRVGGEIVQLAGIRLPGDSVYLIGYGIDPAEIFNLYQERWQIETLFEKLKGHGFDMEASRLRGEGKAEKLMATLALATAWCYAFGTWSIGAVEELKTKAHGRKEKSIFRRGLDLLRQIFHGAARELARLSRMANALFCLQEHLPLLNHG